MLQSSLRATEKLGAQLEEVELASGAAFDGEDSLARQLREVAKVMKSDISNEKMERGAFFTEYVAESGKIKSGCGPRCLGFGGLPYTCT